MPDYLRAQLQTALGAAYTLDRELGGGGMSRVFVAREEALGRAVVVKVLAPELAEGLSAERFARETRLAAAVQAPHVVPVLAAGVTAGTPPVGGLPYYTMPFVEGESLRARLRAQTAQGSPVPLGEAVSILRDVATALDYAHARGIIHRDIKPENILLSGRTAVVTDFGIAKALAAATTATTPHAGAPQARADAPGDPAGAPAATLTRLGTALGTPAYMAPEQAAGEAVDARADVYAWGVVAYELLAGRHPFAGKTSPQQLLTAHLAEVPAPLPTPPVPPTLAALVAQCLAKDPAARPTSAGALLAALDGVRAAGTTAPVGARAPRGRALAAVAAALVLATAGGVAWRHAAGAFGDAGAPAGAPDVDAGAPRVAVLPFENAGPADQAYVADGLTDEVRARIASVPGLTVIARASSNQYRPAPGRAPTPPQTVASELGVRYLLTGTVRSEPGAAGRPTRVRVTPELVEVRGAGAPVSRWQRALDADAADVFAMEADIAERVAGALDVTLGAGTRAHLAEVPTTNPAAYDAYLRGEAAADGLARVDPAALRRALGAYAEATARDTTFADAWARRGQAAALLYGAGVPDPALAEEARVAAARARALAPARAGGQVAWGDYYTWVAQDNARALAAFTAARRLAPGDAEVLARLTDVEGRLGRVADQIGDLQTAVARDPRAVALARGLSVALLFTRRYPEARAAAERALALAPANPSLIDVRAAVALAQGDLAGARRVLAAVPPEVDRDALVAYVGTYWDLVWVLNDADQRRLLALGPAAFDGDRATWGWVLAQTYALRGDAAHARAYADTAHRALQAQLRATPTDAQRWVVDGLALATLGRPAEAVAAAERGAALLPVAQDAVVGAYLQHQLARVYLLTGRPAQALDVLEPLLRLPYYLSPGWLRLDPTFAPLRGTARFARLAAGG
ncbi:hypothetical protein tb265_40120 [Gemmatimonadetes bacterium T265]|nr:hypothetical protein tb265_40120 [Gemmatimonadetes bacterium T265]